MNDKYAQVVHEVIGHGLELKARLVRGESPSMQVEQHRFIQMLTGRSELNQDSTYAGDAVNARLSINPSRAMEPFLGIRYALACWLDEIFIAPDSPWSSQWTSSTLEVFLYGGTQDRAWRFWENAIKAEARPGPDALEVYLWCVLLGFRGDPTQSRVTNVARWIDTTRSRVMSSMPKEFPMPTEREAPSDVPPLHSSDRYGFMLRLFSLLLILTLFVAVFKLFPSFWP